MNIWNQLRYSIQKTIQLVLALSVVTNLAMLALPLYSLQIFDRVLTSSSRETLLMLLAGVVIVGVTAICFEHLRRNTMAELSFYLEDSVFPLLVKRMNLPGFNANKCELLEEYNFTQKQIQGASTLVFVDALLMPLFVVITYFIHPLLGFFTLGVNALLILMVIVKYQWQLPKQFDAQTTRISNQTLMLSNPSALAWLTMTANNERWFTDQKQNWQQQVNTAKKNELPVTLIGNLNQCIRWLAQAGLPTLGAMLLLSNEITTGGFIAGLIIGGKTFMPVEAMIANLDSFKKMKHFFKMLKPILDTDIVDESGYQAELKGYVVLQNLELNQSQQFNLLAKSGDMVALVGPAGAGQDTIIRQLMTYEPVTTGVITIDGVRLDDWNKSYLSQSIGFVSGSIQLPEATIKSIITSFGHVSTTAAIQAAERTGLNAKLIEFGLSYDDTYKFDTVNPSLNLTLRQLIALTAALAIDPQLYVLENPETHMDMESMNLLKNILIQEKQNGKTIILTTQSRSLLQIAEQMVLLNKGKTIFKGKPTEFDMAKQTMTQHKEVPDMSLYHAANQASINERAGVRQ